MLRPTALLLVIFLAAAIPSIAHADDAKDDNNPFAQGTWEMTLAGNYTTHIRFSQAHTYQVTGEVGKYLWDNLSLGAEVQGIYAEQPDNPDVLIGGVGLIGRVHFLHFDDWTVFFDGGGGVTYADDDFPSYPYPGTHFNFTGKLGFGATWHLHDHDFLTGGVRYFHLSNGRIHGPDQNPTYDSIQFWSGWMHTW